jgi:hypothetical protein
MSRSNLATEISLDALLHTPPAPKESHSTTNGWSKSGNCKTGAVVRACCSA